MRVLILIIFYLISVNLLYAQHIIKGKIINADDRHPVAGASVYINNSSLGTSTNKEGEFSLNSSNAIMELVITSIGFERRVVQVQLPLENNLLIAIQEKSTSIQEVVVTNYLKDGWKEWGKFFTENLIGIGDFADKCKILNPEVVKFRYDKKENILIAICTEPLKIRNNSLGYELTYDLANFSMNFKNRMFFFEGYAFFEDIGKIKLKIRKNRNDAYLLSINRFVTSLYNMSWEKDGYVVRKLVKKENELRQEARNKYNEIFNAVRKKYNNNWNLFYASQKDITQDYVSTLQTQMSQPATISYLMGIMQPSDIIKETYPDRNLKHIQFQDYLYLIYPADFTNSKSKLIQKAASEVTEIFLINEEGILIENNGGYYPAADLILSGYAVAYSKLAYLLPLDYLPNDGKK